MRDFENVYNGLGMRCACVYFWLKEVYWLLVLLLLLPFAGI
jgi:hypothetical protein